MRYLGASMVVAALVIMGPPAVQAQTPASVLVTRPLRFESWNPGASPRDGAGRPAIRVEPAGRRQGRNALIGAAVGTVAGLAFCTVVSNLMNDSASGFSTCTLDGYLLTGGVGLAAGLLVGLIV
jgi:hypothetical protein